MSEMPVLISVNMDQEEVGNAFENYNLVSAGVVNKENKLVGMITADDVVTVVKEEAEEDTLRLAGVGDEEITDSVILKTKRRFSWLLLNLFTALLATWVISKFGATIGQMVALAFLMPIVASIFLKNPDYIISSGGDQVKQDTGGYYISPTVFKDVKNEMTVANLIIS